MKLALTGATGFVGGRLLGHAVDAGHDVRALTRRKMRPRHGVTWIEGALDQPASLATLVEDVDTLVHVAGVINGPDAAAFEAGNVAGTAAIIAAAEAAALRCYIHVSSLSAREPELSLYGASKARAEELVTASPLTTVIVRPPAIYGPGDRETLDLFRMAKTGVVVLPPVGRVSLLHVDDLARLLLALAESGSAHDTIFEPDDGRSGGWTYREFAHALGRAVGRKIVTLSTPRPLMTLAARADRLIRGANAKLTPDRVSYFCHDDWTVAPGNEPPETLWRPLIKTEEGLAATARWYRDATWL